MTRTKKRTTRAYVWLTPQEKSDWKNKAASSGMNLNDYIRSCVERRKIAQSLPEVNRVTAVELGKIGVNLNQQIRAMNTAVASEASSPVSDALTSSSESVPDSNASSPTEGAFFQAVGIIQGEVTSDGDKTFVTIGEKSYGLYTHHRRK